MLEVLRETQPKSRKNYRCEFCSGQIEKGQKYNCQTNVFDGDIFNFRVHLGCAAIAIKLGMYNCDYSEGLSADSFQEYINDACSELESGGLIEMKARKTFSLRLHAVLEYHNLTLN